MSWLSQHLLGCSHCLPHPRRSLLVLATCCKELSWISLLTESHGYTTKQSSFSHPLTQTGHNPPQPPIDAPLFSSFFTFSHLIRHLHSRPFEGVGLLPIDPTVMLPLLCVPKFFCSSDAVQHKRNQTISTYFLDEFSADHDDLQLDSSSGFPSLQYTKLAKKMIYFLPLKIQFWRPDEVTSSRLCISRLRRGAFCEIIANMANRAKWKPDILLNN